MERVGMGREREEEWVGGFRLAGAVSVGPLKRSNQCLLSWWSLVFLDVGVVGDAFDESLQKRSVLHGFGQLVHRVGEEVEVGQISPSDL